MNAYGTAQTTGGEGGPVVEVRTAQEFRDAVERAGIKKKADQQQLPRVVKVMADIDLGELANGRGGEVLKRVGRVDVRSQTTIFAPGAGATIRHGILDVKGASNVIIRNLRFRDLWEHDPTEKYDRYDWDYIRINNSGKDHLSHHVWVDHCDFGRCYDGQIDITHGSDLITVSWCRFSGDASGPHHKSILIGHSSSDAAAALDRGRLNVTLHHNLWENILDRAPRVRFGNVHCLNDWVERGRERNDFGHGRRYPGGKLRVSGHPRGDDLLPCQGRRVAQPGRHDLHRGQPQRKSASSKPEKPVPTETDEDDSSTLPVAGPQKQKASDPDREFELATLFKSSVERGQLQFNRPVGWEWDKRNTLPYRYGVDPVTEVPALLSKWAGVGKVPDPELIRSR